MPGHSAASGLGLRCLPKSHKKDARLIWVNIVFLHIEVYKVFGEGSDTCTRILVCFVIKKKITNYFSGQSVHTDICLTENANDVGAILALFDNFSKNHL